MGPCAISHRKAEQIGEMMLQCSQIRIAGIVAAANPRLGWLGRTGQALGVPHRQAFGDDPIGKLLDIGRPDQRASMAHAQAAIHHLVLHGLGQIEQAQQIGDVATRFVDQLAQRLLGMTIIFEQAMIGLGLLRSR